MAKQLRERYETTSDAALEQLIPKGPTGSITSIGSLLHAEGNCRPCRMMMTGESCKYGIRCSYCHLPHEKLQNALRSTLSSLRTGDENTELKCEGRPSKEKRDRYNKFVKRVEEQIEANPFGFNIDAIELPQAWSSKPDLLVKFRMRMQNKLEETRKHAGAATATSSTAAPAQSSGADGSHATRYRRRNLMNL